MNLISNSIISNEGSRNVIADTFSRLPRMDSPASVEDELLNKYEKPRGTEINFEKLKPETDSTDDEIFVNNNEDNKVIECLLNLPEFEQMENPINMKNVFNHQRNDSELMNLCLRYPATY